MMTSKEALAIADAAETASEKDVRAAYYALMINAPCWAFSDDVSGMRIELRRFAEGPQE